MMEKSLVNYVGAKTFNNNSLTIFLYKERPCVLAKELGKLLEYGNEGGRLVKLIRGEWKKNFEEEKYFKILTGKELKEFKELMEAGTLCVSAYASHLMLLFEEGIHMVILKTEKPLGDEIKKFLTEEVMPQIRRDGCFSPDRKVVNGKIVGDKVTQNTPEVSNSDLDEDSDIKRLRLEIKKKKLDLQIEQEKNKMFPKGKVSQLNLLISGMEKNKNFPEEMIHDLKVLTAEIATGLDLRRFKYPGENWESPTKIAKRNGVSKAVVGKVISKLNLRGDIPGMSKSFEINLKSSNLPVSIYKYSQEAVKLIENEIERLKKEVN